MISWCRRATEAGWLAIALLLPLCFNPFAAAPFEPVKVCLFLALVAGMTAARLTQAVLERSSKAASARPPAGWRTVAWRNRLAWPALLYGGVFLLATITSVDPRQSVWGYAHKPHGAVTILALVAFFFLVAGSLRRPAQLDRLVTALILGSAPVMAYGLVQHWGLDPLQWVAAWSPVHSTMGNPVFLSAYLAMVAPFTLLRITGTHGLDRLRYALLLALQVVCLLLTRARSGWLGLLGAVLLFVVYLVWRKRSAALPLAGTIVLVAGGLAFAVMHGSISPPRPIGAVPAAQSDEVPDVAQVRAASMDLRYAIWRSALALVPARWLLGYGPGNLVEAIAPHLARFAPHHPARTVDDPHNILLKHLLSAGILGLAALLGLVGAFASYVSRLARTWTGRVHDTTVMAIAGSAVAFLIYAQLNPDVITLSALFWLDLALVAAIPNLDGPALAG
jgi:O-antigen ligase